MRGPDAPAARAASTYSRSRSDRNSPRTMRAIGIHPSAARITIIPETSVAGGKWNSPKNDGSGLFATTSSTTSAGITRNRSVKRISRLSTQPPRHPASAPTTTPITTEIAATPMPTTSDIRRP